MSETTCFGCGDTLNVQEDEWWSHQWEENPAGESVDEAIERDDFRDWFKENKVFCPGCHKKIITEINNIRHWNDAPEGAL